jgi:hypothetical protein
MTIKIVKHDHDAYATVDFDKPYFVTMITYIFKVGGGWNPQKGFIVPLPHLSMWYKDLNGNYIRLATSANGKLNEWSSDNSAVLSAKVTGFKWKVNRDWWYRYDIDTIKITGLV